MILTTSFPDLPPRPETAANAAFRRSFAARWGRENVVFMASTKRVETPPLVSALSVKLVQQGAATFEIGRRRVLIETGQCLVVNEGERYTVSIASERPVHSFSLHFRPGLAAEVAAARRKTWQQALDPDTAVRATPQLRDELRLPTPALMQLLTAVRERALAGEREGEAYEALFIATLDRLLADDEEVRARCDSLDAVRPATRAELARRAARAHDFIHSNYTEAITLQQIADAAHLSKFHLLRAFRQVYGATPYAMLNARRAEVALRLLRDDDADLAAVAEAAGFGSRWSLQRALRRHCGATGRTLRRSA
jgi:AraC-like DNA-binding protein